MTPSSTFADVISHMLAAGPGRPLITFYDDATEERTELSVTTYANWVAKTSALLVDEYDITRDYRIRIDLPTHWLGPVFLGAAWTIGAIVCDTDQDLEAVICGPDSVEHWADRTDLEVFACALHPMATRFTIPLPAGVHDFGVEVWSQPDAFTPWDPPSPTDLAMDLGGVQVTRAELWRLAAAGSLLTDGGRLLSTANPASPPGIAAVTETFTRNGSLVLVAEASPERLAAIAATERVTS